MTIAKNGEKNGEADLLFAIIIVVLTTIIIVFSLNERPIIALHGNIKRIHLDIFYGAQIGPSPKKRYLPKTTFLRIKQVMKLL